jgi:hypothetical protein
VTKTHLWAIGMGLYAIVGVVDGAARVIEEQRATGTPISASTVAVGFAAGSFWPLDLAGRLLFAAR